jgi:tetratricopeptide (TPR) repeat protein
LAAAPAGETEAQRLRGQAIEHYQAALAQVDRLPLDHANLACLLWAAGRPEAAQQQMQQAHALAPENITFRLNLGYYLEQNGDYPAAWEQYGALLAARPDYLQSSYWQQSDLRAGAKPELIEQAAQKLLNSANPEWSSSIQLFLQAGDVDRAWQIYNEYLDRPENAGPESRLEKGRILLAESHLDEARAALEPLLSKKPAAADAYLLLGQIALARSQPNDAARYLEAALFLAHRPEIIYHTGRAAAATGNDSRALELYEAAFQQLTGPLPDPNLARYATEVARRRPLPLSHLPCLQRIYPTQLLTDITLAEGELLEQQGRYPEAGHVYQRLLSFEPASTTIQTRLEALCQKDPRSCDFRAK